MSFSEHMAKVVADQLERFVTLNRHQLAGHVGNLDFWVNQARHALGVIDGYEGRSFRQLTAETQYVAEQNVVVTSRCDWETPRKPAPPKQIPGRHMQEARRSVTTATYRFLARLCRDGLIPESRAQAICDELGIEVNPKDFWRTSS